MEVQRLKKLFLTSIILIELPAIFTFGGNTLIGAIGSLLLAFVVYKAYQSDSIDMLVSIPKKYINGLTLKWLFIVIAILWIIVSIFKYLVLSYKVMDTAVFANSIVYYIQTGNYFNTFMNVPALADHFNPNLLLFVPLFKIYPTFMWLIFFKILAYLMGPYLLYKIGTLYLDKKSPAIYFMPILWLVHEYLQNTLLYSFQPTSLTIPFILLAFYLAMKRSYVLMFLPLVFVLGFKENAALIWVSLGFFLVFYQRKIWFGSIISILGIIIGLTVYLGAMKYFTIGSDHLAHMDRFGPFSLIPQKMGLLIVCFLSVGLLPLLSPKSVFFTVPAFGMSLVAHYHNMVGTNYHYLDIPLTILFIASIIGLKAFQDKSSWIFKLSDKKKQIAIGLFLWSIFSYNSKLPVYAFRVEWPEYNTIPALVDIIDYRSEIPDDREVWSNNYVSTYLTTHANIQRLLRFPDVDSETTDFNTINYIITQQPHIVVLTKHASFASSEKEYNNIIKWLELKTAQGQYVEMTKYKNLRIFVSN